MLRGQDNGFWHVHTHDGEAVITLVWLAARNPLVNCRGNTFYSLLGMQHASKYPRLCNLICTSVRFERLFSKVSLLDKDRSNLIRLFVHAALERLNGEHICGVHFRPLYWKMCEMLTC